MRNRTTPINRLPFLQENEYFSNDGNVPQNHNNVYSRHIRSRHESPIQSGMAEDFEDIEPYPYNSKPTQFEHYEEKEEPNCVDVANHIKTCPICSRLYDQDRTIFYVIIALLIIICLFLLKRVLNV